MKSALLLLLSVFAVRGCFSRQTKVSESIEIGMTIAKVKKVLGKPYTSGAEEIGNGNLREYLIYREQTWDDGGWSWNRTIHDTIIEFRNGKVVSFGPFRQHQNDTNPVPPLPTGK